ncbi:MAG: hypothetical protein J6W05_11775 [Prevotella sp.]|nr:hypothetical protein [Prevotella sp.]
MKGAEKVLLIDFRFPFSSLLPHVTLYSKIRRSNLMSGYGSLHLIEV